MKTLLTDKPKSNTTVTLHPDVKLKAKTLGLNVSKLAEDAIIKAIAESCGETLIRVSDLSPEEINRYLQAS